MTAATIVIVEEIECYYCEKIGEIRETDTGEDVEITTCECGEFVHHGCLSDHELRCEEDREDARYERWLFYNA